MDPVDQGAAVMGSLVDELLAKDLSEDDDALMKAVQVVDEQEQIALRIPRDEREAEPGATGALTIDSRMPSNVRRLAAKIDQVVLLDLLDP